MSVLTLAELHDIYQREHPKMDKRDKQNIVHAFALIEETIPNLDINTFGKLQFLHFRNELIRRDYARTYCNKLMRKIKTVFRWGATYDLFPVSIYEHIRLVELVKYGETRESTPRKDIDDFTIQSTLGYLPKTLRDMTVFQRVTGMRPSEVCRMKVSDFHSLTHEGLECVVCELKEHKTARFGKTRIVPLNDRALEIVRPYLTNKELDCFVFVTDKQGVPWTVAHWDRVLATIIERHKLTKWTLYQLRHKKGTELSIQEGVEVAAAVLGNSVEVMSKVYDHGKIARLFRSLSVQNAPPKRLEE